MQRLFLLILAMLMLAACTQRALQPAQATAEAVIEQVAPTAKAALEQVAPTVRALVPTPAGSRCSARHCRALSGDKRMRCDRSSTLRRDRRVSY